MLKLNVKSRSPKVSHCQNESGFTLVEILVSLVIVGIILGATSIFVSTAVVINGKSQVKADASEVAFQKLQDYVNTNFSSIPIGDDLTDYEVEDFSDDEVVGKLANVSAKVYVEPASEVNTMSETTTENLSDTSSAVTSFVSGSEITASDTHDPTDCCRYDWRLSDNNDFNLVYNNYDPGSSNQEMPALDLGSSQTVNTIRINWYTCYYTSDNFRIEGSDNGSTWNTVSSGLSTNVSVGCGVGDYPEDYSVSGTYRYWRMFNVTGNNSTWIAMSEMEAFSASSGDVVEQSGTTGNLDFGSSNIRITENGGEGQQSIGLRFLDVNVDQATAIGSARIQFTADSSDSTAVNLQIQGVDTDDATGWSGNNAVTNAVAGPNGTSATIAWGPNSWTSGSSGANESVDVTTIVQEILDRAGWSNGNSMAFAITYGSGSGRRVAQKASAPQLIIDWEETTTTVGGGQYVDVDMDGDADNPTLLKVTTVIEYDSHGSRQNVEYSTFIRQYGIGS